MAKIHEVTECVTFSKNEIIQMMSRFESIRGQSYDPTTRDQLAIEIQLLKTLLPK